MTPRKLELVGNENGHAVAASTCEHCLHWYELERPITAGAMDLSQPRTGQCRERLQVALVQNPEHGGLVPMSFYPGTPHTFPACGQFLER